MPSGSRPLEIGVSGCAMVNNLVTGPVLISGIGFELRIGVGIWRAYEQESREYIAKTE
jgi:hypothetical protein